MVASSPVAGAEMMTFFAPPALCPDAADASVKKPVDSTTMSTPWSAHGSCEGSRSAMTLTSWPSMAMESSDVASTEPGYMP